jgi:hypothetical protein
MDDDFKNTKIYIFMSKQKITNEDNLTINVNSNSEYKINVKYM